MPSCAECLNNMEGLEMYVSEKCKHAICGNCYADLKEAKGDLAVCQCWKCLKSTTLHRAVNFVRVQSPYENIDVRHPANREEAVVAYRKVERMLLDAKPDWSALLGAMEDLHRSSESKLARQDAHITLLADLNAPVDAARSERDAAVAVLEAIAVKAREEQAEVDHRCEELAYCIADAESRERALDATVWREKTRVRLASHERLRESRLFQGAKDRAAVENSRLARRVADERLLQRDMVRRHQARLAAAGRLRQEMESRNLRAALAIFKLFRGSGRVLLALLVLLVVSVQTKFAIEFFFFLKSILWTAGATYGGPSTSYMYEYAKI
ncbi:hypothetical protein BD626DRAFT_181122 [Schizophyllum amplum]|uniref:RING-type domain-containing protein n=1 Tax=Schizophyllum amplum TaxID=97359 RepID=A0A550C1E3_9AGAR|nr:hypothetical protein BD626DRAFT_181122 [Auriculariopsis ampla]